MIFCFAKFNRTRKMKIKLSSLVFLVGIVFGSFLLSTNAEAATFSLYTFRYIGTADVNINKTTFNPGETLILNVNVTGRSGSGTGALTSWVKASVNFLSTDIFNNYTTLGSKNYSFTVQSSPGNYSVNVAPVVTGITQNPNPVTILYTVVPAPGSLGCSTTTAPNRFGTVAGAIAPVQTVANDCSLVHTFCDGNSWGRTDYKCLNGSWLFSSVQAGTDYSVYDLWNVDCPVNGSCGSSNGQSLLSSPTTNLCSTGTASIVSGSGPWTWSCIGASGGTTASCSANKITDNGCVASTCLATTCWNNLAWVSGTKVCADNSCAASTCTTATCWNNLTWIAGTKLCDNGCAAITYTNATCFNGITTVPGTLPLPINGVCGSSNGALFSTAPTTNLCGDGSTPTVSLTVPGPGWSWTCLGSNGGTSANCSAGNNTCAALTYTSQTCPTGIIGPLAWIPGTLPLPASNNCAATICSSNTCYDPYYAALLGNGWVTGTKPQTFSNYSCGHTNSVDCSLPANCAKQNNITAFCTAINDCTLTTDQRPLGECSACAPSTQTCPACPVQITPGTWREVTP